MKENERLIELKLETDKEVAQNIGKFRVTLNYFIIFAFYIATLIFIYYGFLK